MDAKVEAALRDWDPLSDDAAADEGIVLAAQRREIGNILRSYTGYYDLFAELLQNALDALERRLAEDNEGFQPSLDVALPRLG